MSSLAAHTTASLPTYQIDDQPNPQQVTLTEKTLGLRLHCVRVDQNNTPMGGRIILVRNKGASHKAGVVPGSVLVSVNEHSCNTGQTYPEILGMLKESQRPLQLMLNVPKTNSEQLATLASSSKRSLLSIFALVIGNAAITYHWHITYCHDLLQKTCGMFGIDDEEFMSFVPLLSLGVDVPINDAIASFLPHLNLSMQTLCQTIMSSLTLHLLKEELYDARARCVWRDLSVCLGFNAEWFEHEEHLLAMRVQQEIELMHKSNGTNGAGGGDGGDGGVENAVQNSNKSSVLKGFAIGGAAIVGGALVFVTAGLAAPAVAGGVAAVGTGLGIGAVTAGVATFLGSASGMVVLTSVLGTAGGGLSAFKMKTRLANVQDFSFSNFDLNDDTWDSEEEEAEEGEEKEGKEDRESETKGETDNSLAKPHTATLSTVICVSGWLKKDKKKGDSSTRQYRAALLQALHFDEDEDEEEEEKEEEKEGDKEEEDDEEEEDDGRDKTTTSKGPTTTIPVTPRSPTLFSPYAQYYALDWERKELRNLGKAMSSLAAETAVQYGASEVAKKTFLATLMSALAWPATIMALAGYIDNSWSVACSRADKAGGILAEVLESRIHGNNPVTLIGYSTGARVIFNALLQMKTPGIVENVILIGAPVTCETGAWKNARKMVSKRLINAYSSKDWALRFLYRADQFAIGCAGLTPVLDCDEIEQIDIKQAHFGLRDSLGDVLRGIDVRI